MHALLASALALVTVTIAPAQTRSSPPAKAWGVTWQPDLEAALAHAARSSRPVVWFRVLGELEGLC